MVSRRAKELLLADVWRTHLHHFVLDDGPLARILPLQWTICKLMDQPIIARGVVNDSCGLAAEMRRLHHARGNIYRVVRDELAVIVRGMPVVRVATRV